MIRKTTSLTRREGIIFILSAPSGTGKTTLIRALRELCPKIRLSISYTTRRRREGEVHGRDYYFVKPVIFARMKSRGDFAEWAKVHDFFLRDAARPAGAMRPPGRGHSLGHRCPRRDKDQAQVSRCGLDFPGPPPSWRELQRRLARRGTDGKETIRRRLANARDEMREIIKYDYLVVNRDVKASVQLLKSIFEAEQAKTSRLKQWRVAPSD